MNEAIREEILKILSRTIEILEAREEQEIEELKELSEKAVEEVALHKDLDMISVTVLVYSLYKVGKTMPEKDYRRLLEEMREAKGHLKKSALGKYNHNIREIFELLRKSNAKIKEHLQDVMHAARIKKGASLLQKGLSIGQAAGLMGLSNWDLQEYAGKTIILEQHEELMPAGKRMKLALEIFGV